MICLLKRSQTGPIDGDFRYMFDGESIGMYLGNRLIYAEPASLGDVYETKQFQGKIYLDKMGIPENPGAIIAWLLKFNKKTRTTSGERIQQILERECQNCPWNGGFCKPRLLESTGYAFYICEAKNRTGYKSISGWFSDAISKHEVLSLIPLMTYYPEELVKYLLGKHFGISNLEFEEAKKKTKDLF